MAIDPTFSQLKAYIAVCEELHFGRAADRLHITQPPLSKMIRTLEKSLETQLLERTSRRVEITPAGQAFLKDARLLVEHLDRAKRTAREVSQGLGATYRVGYIESAGLDILGSALTAFRLLHPDTHLELHEMHTTEQVERLRDHHLDLGQVRAGAVGEPGIELEDAYEDELVLAVPDQFPIVGESVELARLALEKFVVYHPSLGGGTLNATLEATSKAGFTPRIEHMATSTPMLFSLVAAGEGVALVVERTVRPGRPGIRTVRVTNPVPYIQVYHAWRSGEDNDVLRSFRNLVNKYGAMNSH
ncbi:LysR family transcriptional regulator [Brevibacterium sp.]|uniref:LysR family transcriptional regulator n=1 Tax=Brevibacterium sp. TaxID=1701 RepID=UPI002811526F|nr:LysR family transcriptional regulator [Brevibacterium sp.]